MAEEPELMLETQPDAELSIEGDALPDLMAEDAAELTIEEEPAAENELALPDMSDQPETNMAPQPELLPVEPKPIENIIAQPPSVAQSSPQPASSTGGEAMMDADTAPGVLDALKQVLGAFGRLVDVMPDWAGMVLAATLAALIGLLIGGRLSRRGSSKANEGAAAEPLPPVRAALPAPENPAFKNYQVFLEGKGVSAKERDAQMRAFSERYREMRQNLRDLIPGNKDLDEQVELVRDALDAGDFDRVFGLLTRIGNKENNDGLEKRAAALKHLMAAAIAKSVAGDLQISRLEYESAAENFRQAVEALPPFQEDLHAEFLNKYGTASYQAGHHETAVAAFERALQILEKRLGKNHPDVATALNNLALLHYSRGNYDAAEPLYKRSLAIDEQTLGIDHTGVATDLNNLALLYKKKGNLEEAEPLLRRAMEIKEKNFDPGHPSLVTGLRNYASLLRSLGREEEADIYERRATVLPPSRTGIAAE